MIQSNTVSSSSVTAKLDESPHGSKLFVKIANTVYFVMSFDIFCFDSPVDVDGWGSSLIPFQSGAPESPWHKPKSKRQNLIFYYDLINDMIFFELA